MIILTELLWKIIYFLAPIFIILVVIKFFVLKKDFNFKLGKSSSRGITKGTLKGSGLIKSNNPEGFIFGKKRGKKVFLKNDEEGHIAIFGGSGLGKTTAVLIPTLRAWNSPFFTIDISGDISKNVPVAEHEKVVIKPENPDESFSYNILYFIDKAESEDAKREKIEQLIMLIINIPDNANDAQRYFLETARKIFLGAFLAFYDIGLDFTEICKTIYFHDIGELVNLITKTGNELAIGYIKPLLAENEKNVGGAKNTLNGYIKLFSDNASIEEIVKRPGGFDYKSFNPTMLETKKVFFNVSDKNQEYYTPLINIVISQILEYVSGRVFRPGIDKRILIPLDEFASLGHFNILSPFRKFRKNGANLCILTQSLADIQLVYSDKESKVILDNSKYIVVLSAVENSTREYFSNLVGRQIVQKESKSSGSSGSSTSVSEQKDFIIEPEEWKNLKDYLVVIHPGGFVKLKKNYYFKGK